MISFFAYLFLGCISGFISGLLGVGGGLILVPGLAFIFTTFGVVPESNLIHLCIGTSLASSIVNLAISVKVHERKSAVVWSIFTAMAPGVLVGALLLGPAMMFMINDDYLKITFGIFCLLIAVQMLFNNQILTEQKKMPSNILMSFVGLCIGSLSTVLGIAGGAMIGTILHYYHLDARKVIGTTAAICVVIATAGSIGMMFISYNQPLLPPYSTGFIYWPAFLGVALPSPFFTPLGVSLAHQIPVNLLRKLFAGLMLLIGIKMVM